MSDASAYSVKPPLIRPLTPLEDSLRARLGLANSV
jgi:hypothetical protein